ncbi:MAG: hypothetical protein GXP29_08275, partial [Planctomycetes bacterium]|nr:hypothetical protein [Planctomycetota bacterium]
MIESPIQTTDEQLRGARVVVMGLGRFGGGVGVARFLTDRGADLLITDTASEDSLSRPLAELSRLPIRYRLGGHDVADLDDADLLIVSPAVNRTTSSFFRTAMERGVHWTTEMGMFIERCPARMAGVTGSIGKSTTCAMIDCILASPEATSEGGYARVHLGGNIGRSLLNELHAI